MKKVYTAIGFILLLNSLWAQTTLTITGNVKDKKSNEALVGATINIKGTNKGAATDFEGSFTLKTSENFPFVLVISYIGYITKELTINTQADFAKPLNIKLEENTKELKEVQVTDTRITERQKQAPLTIETMDAVAIKETPAANFYEGLAHLKGVDLTSASIGFKIINTRGFNSTSPVRSLQLIDGVDNQSPGLNFSLGNFLGASELDVQRVDLIVGASSAYYGPAAFNGVINMQTKSPFLFKGLSAQVRVGERNLTEAAVRYAQVIKNKRGEEKFAYKINLFAMRANDWEATNYDATIQSPVGRDNPGGYDAVNIYGDEYATNRFRQTGLPYLGYGYTTRKGYREIDLVDYNSHNIKFNTTLHYKIKNDHELIAATSISNGTTVYQGENRFSLKDIWFYQNRVELRKEGNYFIRVYATHEDAGKSYDAYNTALLLQSYAKPNNDWAIDYAENWNKFIFNRIQPIRPAIGSQPPGVRYEDYANEYLRIFFYDSLRLFHQIVRNITDTSFYLTRGGLNGFEPGTERFDSAFKAITSRTNREGGSRFFDRSALYHVAAEKIINYRNFEFKIGGNFRLYAPNSQGTIFLDTIPNQRIYNKEGGGYLGIERKIDFVNNTLTMKQLKMNLTTRVDKNQNFKALVSPAFTAVYTYNQHVFRGTVSSAIRNPTLIDQYINLNVGPATLLGNLKGFDSLVTVNSLFDALNNGKSRLEYFNVDPVRPERVRTVEAGYRTTLFDKLFIDASYYFSWYTDFLGFKIGADINWPDGDPFIRRINVYRVTTNSKDMVTTQGFTVGLNYFLKSWLGFSGNYSWNKLDRRGSTDPLIPAFNTPEHKYNLGLNGRNINSNIGGLKINNWGYGINYKWQEGFMFEGSPQFTGMVEAYDLLDAQINKSFKDGKLLLKIGANNLLNNRVIQVYGGPSVGRLAYISLLLDLNNL
ncbi:MAG: carboxypeptidase-like regulatory domain-containing protein [Bacteroidia bacterium]